MQPLNQKYLIFYSTLHKKSPGPLLDRIEKPEAQFHNKLLHGVAAVNHDCLTCNTASCIAA